jgi:drug/metabolite transporter (DMT)-like permease
MNDLSGEDRPQQGGSAPASAPSTSLSEATSRPKPIRVDNVPRGIVMMVVATALFTVASAVSKWLVADYPIGEVLFLRSFSSFVTCAAIFLPVQGFKIFATQRPRDHMLRGLSQSISQFALLMAFRLMPIAGAIAISFAAPLFSALVSIVWLRERAGPVRLTALLIGFFGVLIVTAPGTSSLTPGALFALTNAVMYGTVTVAVRGMARTESAMTLVIWQLLMLSILHGMLLVFGWRTPSPLDAALFFSSGFLNAFGQWCWTKSLHMAPAAAVTPFYYLMMVWALLLGFMVWGDVPSPSLLIGSAIVVTTGLFLFWRETRLHRRRA